MNFTAWGSIALSAIAVILLPLLALVWRGAVKWTRTEDKLDHAVGTLERIVQDKDRVHAAMMDQMRADREATDRRLRYIEERFMRAG